MSAIVRAIDVGRGNTKFTKQSTAGRVDCDHFPSLAFFSHADKSNDIGGRRRTVLVPVDGLYYEVGPDVELATDRFRTRQLHDHYFETPEYRALTAGALHYMKVDEVDLLVVGLPVAQFLAKRAALEKSLAGEFQVGKKRTVLVKKVLAVAQPHGALIAFTAAGGLGDGSSENKKLVIDPGAKTFDWLVTRGTRVIPKLSDSVNRGVSDILRTIAEAISHDIEEDYRDLEAIDTGLRTNKPIKIYGKAHDLKRYDSLIQKVTDQALDSLAERLGGTHDVDQIVLVGGGSYLYRKAIKRRFPRHPLHEIEQPIYANVRGFQLIGEEWVRERKDQRNHAATNGLPASPSAAPSAPQEEPEEKSSQLPAADVVSGTAPGSQS
ncbi:PRTRC system protein D [Azohydromonas aeria]|uniref:PRTRC system protein D n=1 Tax=Azohydromonas aeria TaxID=2590212 RepID=UPI0012F7CCB1|nr:PRTRC system protein D [Azohydromonas aeria]